MLRHARTNSPNDNSPSPLASIAAHAYVNFPNFLSNAFLKDLASQGGPAGATGRSSMRCTSPKVWAGVSRPWLKSCAIFSADAARFCARRGLSLMRPCSRIAFNSEGKWGSNCSGVNSSPPLVKSVNICLKLPPNCMFRQALTNSVNDRFPSPLASISTQAYPSLPNFFSNAFLKEFASAGGGSEKLVPRDSKRCTSPSVSAEVRLPCLKVDPDLSNMGSPEEALVEFMLLRPLSRMSFNSAKRPGSNASGVKASSPCVSSSNICLKLPPKWMPRQARTNS
mmetsp:Transcript_4145/g.9361  ORF Transcript_4145/g.9361 Transcript_4145/m.9361 type:complete len:281 (-) Transcript_4145:1-843(-)